MLVGARRGFARADVLGPELIANGSFTGGTTGWTASTSTLSGVAGKMRVTGTASGLGRADQSFATVIGARYRVSAAISGTTTSKSVRVGSSQGGTQLFSATLLPDGAFVREFVAVGTTTWISLCDLGAGADYAEFDNVSVRRVL